jgi:YedE family putative selenium metabolism protein
LHQKFTKLGENILIPGGGNMKDFFNTHKWVIFTGAVIGILAPILQKLGNPGNMGICVACFERDIAGALGMHRAGVVQYIRPEIIGFVFGALIAAFIFREFKARAGSAPIVRFVLGFFAMVGALVFLGCPWRALLRFSGGDGNAILGLAGLAVGVWIGVLFLKRGYNLGRSQETHSSVGLIMPVIMLALLLLLIFKPKLGAGGKEGPIFISEQGPGSMYAPVLISLGVGLLIGFLAQRSRFCTMGAIRDMVLMQDVHLLSGIVALVIFAFVTNLLLKQFHSGFAGQPVAHTNYLWNFAGMVLAGLAFALAGGCPGRQLFMAGEGDGDAAIFVIGMITGAGFAHNFSLASSPNGTGTFGPIAVIIGLVVCLAIGFTMREKWEEV